MPVSCYICGRDFGTKSISIHIPNCIKKWEAEQKKFPKVSLETGGSLLLPLSVLFFLQSQRRPPPAAPVNLEKVISGELRGEELNKFNGEVLQEWNDSALVPCENCKRTFLPSSLVSHQRSCTQHNPMVKPSKEQSYTARANAKVSQYMYYSLVHSHWSRNVEAWFSLV